MKRKDFYIFLSSTFSDIHGERDYLREHAFRRLDMQLRKFGYSLRVMDLRGSSEEDDTTNYDERVLQMCLRRVDDCKPRMIGLLGDRYGWVFYGDKEDYPDYNAFLRSQVSAMPLSVSEAYARIVDRAKDAYGTEITELILDLIAISRNGMPDDLLLSAMETAIGNVSGIIILEIRDYFWGHFRHDLNLSWWAFEHRQFQIFCLAQTDIKKQTTLHRLLVDKLIDKYVLPYFNLDEKIVKKHCKEKKSYYATNPPQANCLFIADCDLRLLAPAGSVPRLAAEKREKQAEQAKDTLRKKSTQTTGLQVLTDVAEQAVC